MQTIRFNNYKVAPKLALNRIAAFYNLPKTLGWKEYIVLSGKHLEGILVTGDTLKQVYLFEFGCITFINFIEDEILAFLQHLESITGTIDYNLYARYHESHILEVSAEGKCKLWRHNAVSMEYQDDIPRILAIILAKSTELYKIETDISKLLVESESFIHHLQKGRLHIHSKRFARVTAKILRFRLDSIGSAGIFDRYAPENESRHTRDIYYRLAEYYELQDRFDIIQGKMDELKKIIGTYSDLSYKQGELRLYFFEIFLLALFPVLHILHLYIDVQQVTNTLKQWLRI